MMEAGRELDALVAEKVMGWEWVSMGPADYDTIWALVPPDITGPDPDYYISMGLGRHYAGPCFSTAIAPAWKVFEHLRDTGKYCCINIQSDFNFVYDVTWVLAEDDEHVYHSLSCSVESAPLAICLAALKAEGITVPTTAPDLPHQQ